MRGALKKAVQKNLCLFRLVVALGTDFPGPLLVHSSKLALEKIRKSMYVYIFFGIPDPLEISLLFEEF